MTPEGPLIRLVDQLCKGKSLTELVEAARYRRAEWRKRSAETETANEESASADTETEDDKK